MTVGAFYLWALAVSLVCWYGVGMAIVSIL